MPKPIRKQSLIHRGYMYVQNRIYYPPPTGGPDPESPSGKRMREAKIWRDGYLAALRDAKKA